MNKYLIILPSYNVEKELKGFLPKMGCYKNDCLFIDDGSLDGTRGILLQYGFIVHSFEHNRGVSDCIQYGMQYAFSKGYEYVIMMDADGQHDPCYLPEFIKGLEEYDAVLGNRFDTNLLIPSPKISSNCFASAFYEEIFGIRFGDVACGFKGIRLSKSLLDYLEGTDGYSIIYRIMSFVCLENVKWKKISISAIYYPDALLFTRNKELSALLKILKESNDVTKCKEIIKIISKQVREGNNFSAELCGIKFYGFKINEYDGYIIQADMKQLADYYLY